MAQLSKDVLAATGAIQRLEDALDTLDQRLTPVAAVETLPLARAFGRILAQDLTAQHNVPGFDNAAVDGYAVAHADLAPTGDTVLPVIGRLPAGALKIPALTRASAMQIFTGAPMPPGADTVFMQEDVRLEPAPLAVTPAGSAPPGISASAPPATHQVRLPQGLALGANRRFAGEDFAQGALVLLAGTRLGAPQIAALAATGNVDIPVYQSLKVAIFSTGNEIYEQGTPHLPYGGQVDANRPMLTALLAARGMAVVDLGILPDNQAVIAAALVRAAKSVDVILTSGGISTGEEDHVKAALSSVGTLDFWRLAIKPGRPIAMGSVGETLFMGMPGNPAAVFITFTRFVGPVLDKLAGGTPCRPMAVPVIADFPYRKKPGRREYLRVRIEAPASLSASFAPDSSTPNSCSYEAGAGLPRAILFEKEGAALISSLTHSTGFVELDETIIEVTPGDRVRYLPFATLMHPDT